MITNEIKESPARRAKVFRSVVIGLAIILMLAFGIYLFIDDSKLTASIKQVNTQPADSSSNRERAQKHTTLAFAQRQGRCRALDYHLKGMAQAKNESDVAAKINILGVLAGEMMNGYPMEALSDPTSRALPVVNTPEGQRGLNEARDAFRATLRSVRGMDGKEAAAKLSESCMACHTNFMREGGQNLSLLGGSPSVH